VSARHLGLSERPHATIRRSRAWTIVTYACAFCGEENEVLVDPSGGRRQAFTEDCAVCCRPNLLTLAVDEDGHVEIRVSQEYEA
jgi:hypothetical protein